MGLGQHRESGGPGVCTKVAESEVSCACSVGKLEEEEEEEEEGGREHGREGRRKEEELGDRRRFSAPTTCYLSCKECRLWSHGWG